MSVTDYLEQCVLNAQAGRDASALRALERSLANCRTEASALENALREALDFATFVARQGAAAALPDWSSLVGVEDGPAIAIDHVRRWLEALWQTSPSPPEQHSDLLENAAALTGAVRMLARQGKMAEAAQMARQAVEAWRHVCKRQPCEERLADALRLRGATEIASGDPRSGAAACGEAARLLRNLAENVALRWRAGHAAALHNLAGARLILGDPHAAAAAIREAVAQRRALTALGGPLFVSELFNSLIEAARISLACAQNQDADLYASEALGHAHDLAALDFELHAPNLMESLRIQAQVGVAMMRWDKVAVAHAAEEHILLRAEADGGPAKPAARARCAHNCAGALAMVGETQEALHKVQHALALFDAIAEGGPLELNRDRAASLQLAGKLCVEVGELESAARHFEDALALQTPEQGGHDLIQRRLSIWLELASVRARTSDLRSAAEASAQAASLATALAAQRAAPGDGVQMARTQLQAGNLWRRLGALDKAVAHYRQAANAKDAGEEAACLELSQIAVRKLIVCLQRAGRGPEAERWRQRFGLSAEP